MKKVLDRIPKPAGALPAKAQAWVLMGLTAVIAATLFTFPGEPAPDPQAGSEAGGPAHPALPGAPVTVGALDSAADRISQEAVRGAEVRLQRDLGLPETREDGLPHPPEAIPSEQPESDAELDGYSAAPSLEETIAQEERMRSYRSLQVPSLVQSRRERLASPSAGSSLPDPPLPAAPRAPVPQVRGGEEAAPDSGPRLHRLRAGEFLEAVLANRLSGEFAGPVDAMVSSDVYDRTRQHLLVPRGARAVGAASRVQDWGQTRLAVTFHDLRLPDGRSVPLGDSPALNQIGETGLRDRVDRHYLSTFAAAGAIGALAGLAQAVSPQEALVTRSGSARVSAGAGLSRSAERVLDRYLNRMPRITVREGHRIRIYLTRDLELPPYQTGAAWTGASPPERARTQAIKEGDPS